MAENRWSHDDSADPLSHHLNESRFRANECDSLSEDWYDSLVLVSRRYVKELIGDAITHNNRSIWNKLEELENTMSANQDKLNAFAQNISADVATVKAEVQALKDAQSAGETLDFSALQSAVDSLHQTATDNAPPAPVDSEPPADGDPVNSGDPQTLPVEGGDALPVSNFPPEDNGSDAPATDGSVDAPAGAQADGGNSDATSSDAPAS